MGSKYQEGDHVYVDGELGKIIAVNYPESNNPEYHINYMNRGDHAPEIKRKSDLEKANLSDQ